MGNLSLKQESPLSWKIRGGALAFGADDLGGVSAVDENSNVYRVKLRTLITTITPLTGETSAFADNSLDQLLNIEPAGTIADHSCALPSDANSDIGQVVGIVSTEEITLLTLTGPASIRGYSAPFLLAPDTLYRYLKIKADTWLQF